MAFAALNAVMAVAEPSRTLAGLTVTLQEADKLRTQRFCQERRSLCMQALWGNGVGVATIAQSVARGLRHDAALRQRHAARFLAELSQLLTPPAGE